MVLKGTIDFIDAPVAFKTVKSGRSEELKDIMAEIKIMSYIGSHTNVVGLLGAYTREIRKGNFNIKSEIVFFSISQNLNYQGLPTLRWNIVLLVTCKTSCGSVEPIQ
jgi:serine/threonine protein kinase